MAIYTYVAKDSQGEYHRGEVDTIDERQASQLLRRKQLTVISLALKNVNQGKIWDLFINKIAFSDIVVMTRQLATMINAGLVLSESLDILEEQQENPKFKKILLDISREVKGGLDFATAVEKYPDVFPSLYSKLIRAGQASGKLDVILEELANNLEKDREFKSKITGAMIYPVVVITMMFGVMLIMIFFVMPKLLGLYSESGIELPLMTKIVIGITTFILGYWWAMLLVGIVVVLLVKRYISTPDGKIVYDTLLLKMPVVGKINKLIVLTSFTRTFALLTASGIAILESIKIVSNIVGNSVYKAGFENAYKGVERGLNFSSQLLSMPIFPRLVGQMIKTGEETGKLEEIMTKLADYFESETDHTLKNITTLIEPLVLVVLGVGVAFLVISIILPIYQLTTNMK